MTGIQIEALSSMIENVAAGKIGYDSGVRLMTTASPGIDEDRARSLLGDQTEIEAALAEKAAAEAK